MISTRGINPEEKNFHNTRIKVYPRTVKLEDINYWKENDRTILQFDILHSMINKPLSRTSMDELIDFLVKQKVLAIRKLADSIRNNDVKVPLIIMADGKLLDGNRRYFACYYLKLEAERGKNPRPKILDEIPVWVLRNRDIDKRKELKILAEANFVDSNKVEWPLDVKAKVINDHYLHCTNSGMSAEKALNDIQDVYSVEKQQANDYIDTMVLTEEFISSEKGTLQKNKLRSIVQQKFLHFWEFKNKSSVLTRNDLRKVKKLFFITLKNGQLKNFKLVEPMIWAIGEEDEWDILCESKGSKLKQIEALYKETKAIRSDEDKIQSFIKWTTKKMERKSFTRKTNILLSRLYRLIGKIINKEK